MEVTPVVTIMMGIVIIIIIMTIVIIINIIIVIMTIIFLIIIIIIVVILLVFYLLLSSLWLSLFSLLSYQQGRANEMSILLALCEGNSAVNGRFHSHWDNDVFMSWRHHVENFVDAVSYDSWPKKRQSRKKIIPISHLRE